jgi:hypothetical protein
MKEKGAPGGEREKKADTGWGCKRDREDPPKKRRLCPRKCPKEEPNQKR